ncbi:baseplate assembly protein [Vibrio phage ST2-1pr]|uniref:gpW family head-tail joining protein n=1 Tax=Vibrio sp. St2 TaxID=2853441 RepID=UPI001C78ACD9|nr:gpW family head-tail joining protein [Vibrio sp. St2]QXM18755.1 baseplate assembly protein [Vibrio phage ST2-1pr]
MLDKQTLLKEAEQAYHNLMTGTSTVRVKKDGREVEFGRADADKLKAYIEQLKVELGMTTRRRRPAGVYL